MAPATWEVGFARFFPYPQPPTSLPAGLRLIPKGKNVSQGTWISATSSATIRLFNPTAGSAVISVSLNGKIYEEHYVSNLHFSWPQVACVPECPVRGSRVVIPSYRDCNSQVQKFAMRFSTYPEAEAFFNSVKECLRDTIDVGPSGCELMYLNSSPSEFIASNGLHQRSDEGSIDQEPIATHKMPRHPLALDNHKLEAAHKMPVHPFALDNHEIEAPLQPLLASNIEGIFSGFPPSFTDMLTNCTTEAERGYEGHLDSMVGSDLASQKEEYMMDHPLQGSATAPELMDTEEPELRAHIAKYLSDTSFHDMLFKIERVIDELGGDMTL